MKRLPLLLIGALGCAILIALCVWQVQRLAWKEAQLARIEAAIGGDPVPLAQALSRPDPEWAAVRVEGAYLPGDVRIITSAEGIGPAFLVLQGFATEAGPRVLVDRGALPADMRDVALPAGPATVTVTGNLRTPDEVDAFTPDPDPEAGLWYARDVPAIAAHLGTEPILIIARSEDPAPPGVAPQPVDTGAIPNNHLNYAITWGLLALVWAAMTGYAWRRRSSE
ncbi:MAG: SURF1 family protein [Paracoccaceae bacterium]